MGAMADSVLTTRAATDSAQNEGREQPARRLTSKGERRRQEVLARAAVLFDEVGYHGTSISAIAAAAKMTKANVYHYFKAKHDILYAIHDQWIEDLIDGFCRSARTERDVERLLRAVFYDVLFVIHTKRSHVRVYFEYMRDLPPELQEQARRKRDRYEQLVEDVVRTGMEQGVLEARSARVATLGLFGTCNWAYQWYRPGGAMTHQEVAAELFRLYMGGLRAAGSPGR